MTHVRGLDPDTSLLEMKGVGESIYQKLQRLDLSTVEDLVENIPRSFDDYSRLTKISQVRPGKVSIQATIHNVTSRYSKNGLPIVEAVARDGSGDLHLVWFNQSYIARTIKQDTEYFISGEFAKNYRYFAITNPRIEEVSSFPKHTARLVPNYRLTKGITSFTLRKLIATALDSIEIAETLPEWLVADLGLTPRKQALRAIHFPEDEALFIQSKNRLAFEELFVIMLASELNRIEFARKNSYQHVIYDTNLQEVTRSLPFSLTDDQRIATWKLLQMTTATTPMNALLQGDVGSGKTIVALLLAVNAIANNSQVAFMAPTELLAKQHYESLMKLLPKTYHSQTELLTGSMSAKEKRRSYEQIQNGQMRLIIGTHALIQEKLIFDDLQLVIVDEQHRFGVEQRKSLQNKADKMPHVLHMSATPIPRSIALTLYGELDIVTIKHKPMLRKQVQTSTISADNRKKLYTSTIADVIERKEQVFIVAPLIEETEKTAKKISVETVEVDIRKWLPSARIAVIHGKMKQDEKDRIMQMMNDGEVDVLIATTVIEVGIDIPNATLMIIENADSFGLAQLHQLRGRVGRGEKQGRCILVSYQNQANQRLRVMETEYSGFTLAEYDLELRGPGAIYGNMQHGALDLRIAKISDTELIESARNYAKEFFVRKEKLIKYPKLLRRVENIRAITNLN